MEPKTTFADRLNELKKINGLTNTELAKICKIDKSNITRYCKGEYKAKQDVIYRIAEAFGVDVAWLMGYDVPMIPKNKNAEVHHIANVVPLTKEEERFLAVFRKLSDDQRTGIIAQVEALVRLKGDK